MLNELIEISDVYLLCKHHYFNGYLIVRFQEYQYPLHGRSLELLRGWKSQKTIFFVTKYGAKLVVQEGMGLKEGGGEGESKNSSVGRYGLFSETTHCLFC